MSPRAAAARVTLLGCAGAALLAVVAQRYPVSTFGARCDIWPPLEVQLRYGAVYVAGLALLTLAWRQAMRASLSLRVLAWCGLLVHAVALIGPPYLSNDVLFYTAIGRAMADHGHGPLVPLDQSLPPGDALLQLLPVDWRSGTSAYFAGFNHLAALIGRIAHDRLWLHLRLYQLVGLLAMLGAAWFTSRAKAAVEGEDAAPRAFALVFFCPLAVIEATQNAHNDALVALAVAAWAWLLVRGRGGVALAALGAGLLVKASALLPLGLDVTRRLLAQVKQHLTPARVAVLGAASVIAIMLGFLALTRRYPVVLSFAAFVGSPEDAYEHCTRSVECLPRAILRYLLDQKQAAWALGLCVRGLAGVWLLHAASRAARVARPLSEVATGMFIYYLLLHGFMQSWYLLALLPLVPFAKPALAGPMRLFLVCAVAYYPLDLAFNCAAPVGLAFKEFFEAFITAFIPSLVLVIRARRDAAP